MSHEIVVAPLAPGETITTPARLTTAKHHYDFARALLHVCHRPDLAAEVFDVARSIEEMENP